MAGPTITTSRSKLMHTSLAYLSTELRTFDVILHHDSFRGTLVPGRIKLPVEILLLIRLHLLPVVTTHLFERSTRALARYETSVRKLLCQDCLSYNQEVYGPDIWGWEHFTGACLCRGIRNRADEGGREHRRASEYCDLWKQEQTFPDCSTWLELYLSLESLQLNGFQNSIQSIWDVVTLVLKDHGCRLSDRGTRALNLYSKGNSITLDIATPIVIVPEPPAHIPDSPELSIVLRRADRDLSLSFAYERDLELWKGVHSHSEVCSRSNGKAASMPWCIQSQAVKIASTISTAVVTAVSLPITLATVALTIVCFYSLKSRALRIL